MFMVIDLHRRYTHTHTHKQTRTDIHIHGYKRKHANIHMQTHNEMLMVTDEFSSLTVHKYTR